MDLWKPSYWYERQYLGVAVIEVDNRIFLLGLDNLYRNAMKGYESRTLLACARVVAQQLQVQPADDPALLRHPRRQLLHRLEEQLGKVHEHHDLTDRQSIDAHLMSSPRQRQCDRHAGEREHQRQVDR